MSGAQLRVRVVSEGGPLEFVVVRIPGQKKGGMTDSLGQIALPELATGAFTLELALAGYYSQTVEIVLEPGKTAQVEAELRPMALQEIVITGTMKAVRRSDSPIPVEIITPKLFSRNPVPSLFEAVGMVSGVQPVINCNVCNTGDIHINGMEGPYTLVLLDGMPIVSGLGTVYGLMGIPNSLIEQVEIVKGPAASLYGPEAMAGMINVITRTPANAPRLSVDVFGTSWAEINIDAGATIRTGKNSRSLLGINAFYYDNPIDRNGDNFTDLTLQQRISVFNKWQWDRPEGRAGQIGARYVQEDRWGGEMNFTPAFRGGDSIYGESINTRRAEIFGVYELPLRPKIITQFSFNTHRQYSDYGVMPFNAHQEIGFMQTYWDKSLGTHELLLGAGLKYTGYDDDTPATTTAESDLLPGIFAQDAWSFNKKSTLLTGLRTDFHKNHGVVWSPRVALKHSPNERNTFRGSVGSGFRVVHIFTEDHAALSGARKVILAETLKPERSWGGNMNWHWVLPQQRWFASVDLTGFYTWFSNRITADYDSDPESIIYKNLQGHAVSRGLTLQVDYSDFRPLKLLAGITYMDVYQKTPDEEGRIFKTLQVHAPHWSGTWSANYTHTKSGLSFDLTGNWYGPQRLPVLPNDFRPAHSPWFALVNLQLSRKFAHGLELYGGVKNLLNFVPRDPIMRPFDPFDKSVNDPVNNPNGYTFDPTYNYTSLQGIRGFVGFRWKW